MFRFSEAQAWGPCSDFNLSGIQRICRKSVICPILKDQTPGERLDPGSLTNSSILGNPPGLLGQPWSPFLRREASVLIRT